MKKIGALLLMLLVTTTSQPAAGRSASAVITVNTNTEAVSDGLCSLREAITAANLNLPIDGCPAGAPGDIPADVIQFAEPAMVIYLLLAGADEDSNLTGDLDILESVIIEGNGAAVHGYGDRVFEVWGGYVSFQDLRISDGSGVDFGSGILARESAVQLTLDRVNVTNNEGALSGGGIYSQVALLVRHSAIFDNSSNHGTGTFIDNTELVLENSTVAYNQSSNENGGGIYLFQQAQAIIRNSTIASNSPDGIFTEIGSVTYLRDSMIVGNTEHDCGGAAIIYISEGYNVLPANNECGILTATDQVPDGRLLGDFAYWGGPTMNFLLLPDTVAVDNGSCSDGDLTVDQRGVARPQGEGCDIGAHERLPNPYTLYLPNVLN